MDPLRSRSILTELSITIVGYLRYSRINLEAEEIFYTKPNIRNTNTIHQLAEISIGVYFFRWVMSKFGAAW